MRYSQSSFFAGAASGAAAAVTALVLLGHAQPMTGQPFTATPLELTSTVQQYESTDYFVTGDTSSATLWRRERNGTLTCVSINGCRRPQGE